MDAGASDYRDDRACHRNRAEGAKTGPGLTRSRERRDRRRPDLLFTDFSDFICQRLLLHVPPDSDISQKLQQARTTVNPFGFSLGPPNPVSCSESDIVELLRVAKEYCPEAVPEIQRGMTLCGR